MVEYYNGWLSLSEKLPLRAVDIYIQASFPNFLLPKVVLQFKNCTPACRLIVRSAGRLSSTSPRTQNGLFCLFLYADRKD